MYEDSVRIIDSRRRLKTSSVFDFLLPQVTRCVQLNIVDHLQFSAYTGSSCSIKSHQNGTSQFQFTIMSVSVLRWLISNSWNFVQIWIIFVRSVFGGFFLHCPPFHALFARGYHWTMLIGKKPKAFKVTPSTTTTTPRRRTKKLNFMEREGLCEVLRNWIRCTTMGLRNVLGNGQIHHKQKRRIHSHSRRTNFGRTSKFSKKLFRFPQFQLPKIPCKLVYQFCCCWCYCCSFCNIRKCTSSNMKKEAAPSSHWFMKCDFLMFSEFFCTDT